MFKLHLSLQFVILNQKVNVLWLSCFCSPTIASIFLIQFQMQNFSDRKEYQNFPYQNQIKSKLKIFNVKNRISNN